MNYFTYYVDFYNIYLLNILYLFIKSFDIEIKTSCAQKNAFSTDTKFNVNYAAFFLVFLGQTEKQILNLFLGNKRCKNQINFKKAGFFKNQTYTTYVFFFFNPCIYSV